MQLLNIESGVVSEIKIDQRVENVRDNCIDENNE